MKYKLKTLKNGLRIMTVPMKESQSAIVMVLVNVGSHYETKAQNGIAHFLEHMCFKGTTKRTYAELNEELDGLGASYNAFTDIQQTGYYAKAHYKKINQLIEIISDMYLNQTLPEGEIEKERGVILDEINMYLDMPGRLAWYALHKSMYGKTAFGRTVLGQPENIKKISKRDFLNFKKKYYNAKNTLVIVAGNIDHKDVSKEIESHFKNLEKGEESKLSQVKFIKGPKIELHHKKTDQTKMLLGFKSYDIHDERSWVAYVLAHILGGGMSSRLVKELREERGLCYSVGASNLNYLNHGEFIINLGVHHKKSAESLELIYKELKDLKTNLVSRQELKKAKEYMIGNFAISLETSSSLADFYGFQEIRKEKVLSPSEYVKKIQSITPEMIREVARDIFVNSGSHLAIVGPSKKKEIFQKLIKENQL